MESSKQIEEEKDLVSVFDRFGEGKASHNEVMRRISYFECCFENIFTDPEWRKQVTPQTRKGLAAFFTHHYKLVRPYVFLVLARYADLNSATIQRILTLYAQTLQFQEWYVGGGGDKFQGPYYKIDIDPCYWFHMVNQLGELPQEFLKMFHDRFSELMSEYSPGTAFFVVSKDCEKCVLPKNFHYLFIRHLLDIKVFVDVGETCPCLSSKIPFMHAPYTFTSSEIEKLLEEN